MARLATGRWARSLTGGPLSPGFCSTRRTVVDGRELFSWLSGARRFGRREFSGTDFALVSCCGSCDRLLRLALLSGSHLSLGCAVSHGSATGDPIQSSCSTAAVPRLPTRQRAAGTRGSACSAGRKRDQSTLSLARRSGSMQRATITCFAHYAVGFLRLRLRVTRLTTPPARPFFASH